jgi:hypothetical protein
MMTSDSYLRPGQAAQALNVSTETLRLWEVGGKLPFEVQRTEGGERRYPATHVHALADAMSGKTPADVLATMANMQLVPAPPPPLRFHHANAEARSIASRSLRPLSGPALAVSSPSPWRESEIPEEYAVLALAHDEDGWPRIGCPKGKHGMLVIDLVATGGPLTGLVVPLKIDILGQWPSFEPRIRNWLTHLTDGRFDGTQNLNADSLYETAASGMYLARISTRSQPPVCMIITERRPVDPASALLPIRNS